MALHGTERRGPQAAVTRRRFLTRVARLGGVSLAYEAMTGLGLLATPSQAPFDLAGRVNRVRVVILGAGLSGMTAAYELAKVGFDCRVLEARARPGGRVFTVRRGTASEETGPTQTAAFDDGLYFNAGPMRISHHHHTTLGTAASCEWRPRCSCPIARAHTWPRPAGRLRVAAYVFARPAPISTATLPSC